MKFKSIEWKNIRSFGEEIQKVEFVDGELVLLKGISGSGKSTILSLPCIALFGKTPGLTKSAIHNRINKHGWVKAIIEKGEHEYIIERSFTPNDLQVFRDGVNINSYGTSSAQDYIDKEIADIPIKAFSNMISISMKKFKSFLTMSPADRKEIIDRVFNLEVVNIAFEKIKKDAREIGNMINSNNNTLFQLTQTLNNANIELSKLQQSSQTEENKEIIRTNTEKISKDNENIKKLTDALSTYTQKQTEALGSITEIKQKQYENNYNIQIIQQKIDLYSQDKCPTCGMSFSTDSVKDLKTKLFNLKAEKDNITIELNRQLEKANTDYNAITEYIGKLNTAIYQLNSDIQQLTAQNTALNEQLKNNAEFQGINNIINNTTKQIEDINKQLSEDSAKLKELQTLAIVYSIDGVKQKVIVNYLPILNKEIEDNLELVNFPYQLEIDTKFEPHLKELGVELTPESLSDGEETRVDLIVLCSLFKLLKRRFPSINILSIDEVLSSLDNETSGLVLDFLRHFAQENNLSCFIVSHTDLYLDNFNKIISVTKDGFSKIEITKAIN